MNPVIEFQDVSKRFGRKLVLDHVNFHVPAGTVFALLGENGAGKTTSIKSMLGLCRPESGTIRVLGLDPHRDGTEIRHRVGFVPEQPQMYGWMKVDEIGWFAAGFYADGYFDEFVRRVEAFGVPRGQKIDELSKGMRSKVALALALAHDPELLILDEPTSGLDPLVRREFLESMVDRAATGKTVLLASHQINEVERVADYVAIISGGKLAVVDRLEDLKERLAQLLITVRESFVPLPQLNGHVVRSFRRGRQWQALVADVGPPQLDQLRGQDFVESVEARRPSLEEIYIAYAGSATSAIADRSNSLEESAP
jgi:ABC-2 type transport system ATP-binding protein